MSLHSFTTLLDELLTGSVVRGAIVCVSPELYARLSLDQRRWLWSFALESRAGLITDLRLESPVVIHHGDRPDGGAGVESAAIV